MKMPVGASVNRWRAGRDRPLVIGLVNNTSDRALKATEGHFLRLLRAASPSDEFRVRLFTCPEVPRSERPQARVDNPYSEFGELFTSRVDALIVTGMEPQAAALRDEPIWRSLTSLVDWAEEHAVPVIWSCLAAHAAIFHLDGISRTPLPEKLSGVFDCHVVAANHPLMSGLPQRWPSPHSRHFGLPEDALVAKGYQLLSRSVEAGPDVFLRNGGTSFVFLQGHPEYYGDTLLREYRRDVRRFLAGERDEYPSSPRWYFDARTEATLAGLRHHALRAPRDPAILVELARLTGAAHSDPWHASAVVFYANWLAHIVRGDLRSGIGERLRPGIAERRLRYDPSNGGVALNR